MTAREAAALAHRPECAVVDDLQDDHSVPAPADDRAGAGLAVPQGVGHASRTGPGEQALLNRRQVGKG